MNTSRPATISLVLVNALVLLGPLAFGWNLATLLLLYWLELVFVGLINIAQMLRASQLGELGQSRSYQVIFFIAHYATFCVIYGATLGRFIAGPEADLGGSLIGLLIASTALLASHIYSYRVNYIGVAEYQKVSSLEQMFVPYRRAVPVQIAIVIGAIAAREMGESVPALAALVCVKLIVDLAVHLRHHKAFV